MLSFIKRLFGFTPRRAVQYPTITDKQLQYLRSWFPVQPIHVLNLPDDVLIKIAAFTYAVGMNSPNLRITLLLLTNTKICEYDETTMMVRRHPQTVTTNNQN